MHLGYNVHYKKIGAAPVIRWGVGGRFASRPRPPPLRMAMENKTRALVIEQPVPIRKQVYAYIREQILNHRIEPSSRLVEAQIAKEIGISRTPVREALHLLEKDGLVEAIPRVGYRVRKLALDELEEIFAIRSVNEKLAAQWALKRMDAKSLRALETNVAKTKAALNQGHSEAFLAFDEEFHEILARAAGSKHLFDLCQQLRRLILRYRIESLRYSTCIEGAVEGHQRIVEALRRGDQKDLDAAISDHLNYSQADIREQMQAHPAMSA